MHLDINWRKQESKVWDDVSYELRPLKTWAFHKITSLMQQHGLTGNTDGNVAVDAGTLIQEAWAILPEHVRNISGLTIEVDGETKVVTPDMLMEDARMMPLVTEIIVALVGLSNLKDDDVKNSGRPPHSDSAVSASGSKEGEPSPD